MLQENMLKFHAVLFPQKTHPITFQFQILFTKAIFVILLEILFWV